MSDTVDAPHLQVAVEQSDRSGVPGGRITLTAEVRLPPDIHVYAPGTNGYKVVDLSFEPQPGLEMTPSIYPRPKVLYMSAIKERVPVFEGTFRIRQDLKVSAANAFSSSLGTTGKIFTISGKLAYQACDSKQCFFPKSVPVHWQVQIIPLIGRGRRKTYSTNSVSLSHAQKARGGDPFGHLIYAISTRPATPRMTALL